ncbi:MAG: PepSY domain-containing protein [Pseudomonadota bacterium]
MTRLDHYLYRRALKGGLLGLGCLLFSASPGADQHWHSLHDDVQRGDVVPLENILDWLDAHYIGDVLEVEVERDDGEVEYEIKLLGERGQIVEFEFDGHTGQLMEIEGVHIDAMRRP